MKHGKIKASSGLIFNAISGIMMAVSVIGILSI